MTSPERSVKVLVADKFETSGLEGLRALGCDVLYRPDLKDDALTEAIRASGAEVLIVRSTKVTRAMLEAGRLALVVRAGAGYNTIDVEAASERGIYVANCPGKNSIAVAELAFGLILALDRRIAEGAADLKRGVWNKKEYSKARGLFGRDARPPRPRRNRTGDGPARPRLRHARRRLEPQAHAGEGGGARHRRPRDAGRGRGRFGRRERPPRVEARDPGPLRRRRSSRRCGRARSSSTRRARRSSDQAALERAVREKGLRAGARRLRRRAGGRHGRGHGRRSFRLPGVIGTHHIGASTDQAQEAIAAETVRIVREFRDTGRPPNVVNLARKSPATHLLVVRHYDRVGVLAAVFDRLQGGRDQRPGDGEHRLRRRARGRRADPHERRAFGGRARGDAPRDPRHHRAGGASALTGAAGVGGRSFQFRMAFQTRRKSESVR